MSVWIVKHEQRFINVYNIKKGKSMHILPTIIMLESFAAGLIYIAIWKPGPALYWIAAGFLNLAVIYLIPGGK